MWIHSPCRGVIYYIGSFARKNRCPLRRKCTPCGKQCDVWHFLYCLFYGNNFVFFISESNFTSSRAFRRNGISSDIGKFLASSTCNNTSPTIPVAPTTATFILNIFYVKNTQSQ